MCTLQKKKIRFPVERFSVVKWNVSDLGTLYLVATRSFIHAPFTPQKFNYFYEYFPTAATLRRNSIFSFKHRHLVVIVYFVPQWNSSSQNKILTLLNFPFCSLVSPIEVHFSPFVNCLHFFCSPQLLSHKTYMLKRFHNWNFDSFLIWLWAMYVDKTFSFVLINVDQKFHVLYRKLKMLVQFLKRFDRVRRCVACSDIFCMCHQWTTCTGKKQL